MSTPAQNDFKVAKDQWKKWDRAERLLFNDLFRLMHDQRLFNAHPKTKQIPRHGWRTVAWNAAWMAADNHRYRRLQVEKQEARKRRKRA